jgi:esterase
MLRDGAARWGLAGEPLDLPQQHTVMLGDLRFRYLDWGDAPTLRPLLLLHGGGLTAHAWDLVCLGLRRQWRCLALDARGHGDSAWSPNADYTIAAHHRDALALLDHLGIDEVALVGHSMGAFTSIKLASQNPQRIAALTIVDVGPEPREEGTKKLRGFVGQSDEFTSLNDAVQKVLAYAPRRNPASIERTLKLALRQGDDGRWRWKYDPARYAQLRRDVYRQDRLALWHDLRQVRCPAQVIRGENSLVFLQQDAVSVAAALPNGRWIGAPGAGHNVHSENPRVIIDSVRELLTGAGYL